MVKKSRQLFCGKILIIIMLSLIGLVSCILPPAKNSSDNASTPEKTGAQVLILPTDLRFRYTFPQTTSLPATNTQNQQ